MADQTKLVEWLLHHQHELDLRVTECTWAAELFPGLYDLDVEMTLDGMKYSGRGADRNAEIALSKAAAEALERFVCERKGVSTCGVAAHLSIELARHQASNELLERIWLREHFSHAFQIDGVETESFSFGECDIRVLMSKIFLHKRYIVVAMADGREFGFGCALGLAADQTEAVAREKALVECLRNATAQIESPQLGLPLAEYQKIEWPTAEEQRCLLLDQDFGQQIVSQVLRRGDGTDLRYTEEFSELGAELELLKDCPLKFIQATCRTELHSKPLEFVG